MLDKKWFLNIKKVAHPHATLICFPYGGGSASFFWNWQTIPLDIDIWALKLPGRDNRITEAAITSSSELITHILNAFPQVFENDFILYGHSMGAGIAFETILALQNQQRQLPALLIASGREPPHCEYRFHVNHMDDEELLQYIQKLGGVGQKIPHNKEFLQHYIPKVRSDYVLNSNLPRHNIIQLPMPIATINGHQDPLLRMETLALWKEYSSQTYENDILEGNHFFMESNPELFLDKVKCHIERLVLNIK